jgi:hypothetical protein
MKYKPEIKIPVKYTAEQKNSLETANYFINLLQNATPWNEEAEKYIKKELLFFESIPKVIENNAISINFLLKEIDKDGSVRKNSVHKVTCYRCNTKTESKPVGVKIMADGFSYLEFNCKKCKRKFEDVNPFDIDELFLCLQKSINEGSSTYGGRIPEQFKTVFSEKEIEGRKINLEALRNQIKKTKDKLIQCEEIGKGMHDSIQEMKKNHDQGVNLFGIRPPSKAAEYTDEEKELWTLIEHLRNERKRAIATGMPEPEHITTFFKQLDFVEYDIKKSISTRTDTYTMFENRDAKEWDVLCEIDCPDCKKTFQLKPIGEGKYANLGKHMHFMCPDCKKIIIDPYSNNFPDLIIQFTKEIDLINIELENNKPDDELKEKYFSELKIYNGKRETAIDAQAKIDHLLIEFEAGSKRLENIVLDQLKQLIKIKQDLKGNVSTFKVIDQKDLN